ncbi:MAG: LPS export ABC transporter periplasmic protein LptC [Rhizomicrobium sp.]
MTPLEPTNEALGNPLTRLSASKPSLNWTARQRATTIDVQRYTRFVGIMKRALPMAAAALLAAVIAYSVQPRMQDSKKIALTLQRLDIVNNDLAMIKPKLTGIDSAGNPFVVTADQAIQDPHDGKRAQLKNVEADLTLKSGTWLNATATHGLLDATAAPGGASTRAGAKQTQKLSVDGVVDVYSDNGYEVHTTKADIDMARGIVVGNRPVKGQGPFGTFRADRFKIDRDTKLVYLYGDVRMRLFLHGMKHR